MADLDLDYLLDDYQIPHTPVARQLPGYSHVGELEERKQTETGYQTINVKIPSCGGVGIDISVSKENFVTDSTVTKLATKIKQTRPSLDTLYWDVAKGEFKSNEQAFNNL
ncbi:MAG: hypothetical protein GDA56_21845 [Hormoscilla sp. GM7CHS1pb]|nr:hypothetical protein [Hormoscilla sp. GM7CHS1pb]